METLNDLINKDTIPASNMEVGDKKPSAINKIISAVRNAIGVVLDTGSRILKGGFSALKEFLTRHLEDEIPGSDKEIIETNKPPEESTIMAEPNTES